MHGSKNAFPIKKTFGLVASFVASFAIASPAFGAVAVTPPPVAPLADTACSQQALSQPLLAFGDANYYVLAPGGTFSSTGGWYLASGAKITSTVQPDGTTGGVLSLTGKAQATSPVMCITNAYPMARVFSRNPTGSGTGNA